MRGRRLNYDVGLFTLHYCTIVAVSATDGRSNDTLEIYHTNRLSRYRYLQDGAVWHVQSITLDMDLVRGHCNGTRYVVRQISRRYIEAELACSQQSRLFAVHSVDTAVAYVFTHRCTWRRRDAEVRKTFVFL